MELMKIKPAGRWLVMCSLPPAPDHMFVLTVHFAHHYKPVDVGCNTDPALAPCKQLTSNLRYRKLFALAII